MRNIQTASVVAILLIVASGCVKTVREGELGPTGAQKKIMIAVYPSEYKNRVAQGLADRYRDRSKVTLVSIRKLNSVEYRNYDALVIIDALMAWQMFNVDSGWFVGKIKEQETLKKVVLYLTAGDPKENYRFRGIDCITGASVMSGEGEAIEKISVKVDALLKKQ
jgi:hypothetical protein